jgi:hypothetical protein
MKIKSNKWQSNSNSFNSIKKNIEEWKISIKWQKVNYKSKINSIILSSGEYKTKHQVLNHLDLSIINNFNKKFNYMKEKLKHFLNSFKLNILQKFKDWKGKINHIKLLSIICKTPKLSMHFNNFHNKL